MKQDVFDYIMKHPKSSHHDIAKEFSISEIKTIRLLNRLEADNMIFREVLPLGNELDADNSSFFVARTKYSTAFKDITATKALKVFLSDAEERLDIKGGSKNKEFIHHYTNLSVVKAMFQSRLWHLGNPKDMNDQLEYKNGDLKNWDDIFFSSFMMEDKESIGMWSMYAQPWERGVKITLPSKIVIDWIEGIKEILEVNLDTYRLTERRVTTLSNEIKITSVAYCNTNYSEEKEMDEVYWSTAKNNHFKYHDCKKRLTGYIKDVAWSYEKEIRIRAEFRNSQGFKRVAIKIPDYVFDAMTFTPSPLFDNDFVDEISEDTLKKVRVEDSLFKGRLNIHTICQGCEFKKNA